MNIVFFQKTGDLACDLALEIVHDYESWCVILKGLPSTVDVQYNDILNVLDHCCFL